jgi:hypothetical protein
MKKLLILILVAGLFTACVGESEDLGSRVPKLSSLQQGQVEKDCGEDKSNCVANVTVPEGFSYNTSQLFYYGDTVYASFKEATSDRVCVFENDVELFCDAMVAGSNAFILDVVNVLGAPVFTYTVDDEEEEFGIKAQSYYRGEFLNEKYEVDESYRPFEFEDKFGFIAKLDGEVVVVFDGEVFETPFSSYRGYSCCATFPDGFSLYESGQLKLTASVDEEKVSVVIDLIQ